MTGDEKVRPGRECRECHEDRRAEMVRARSKTDGHATVCRSCKRTESAQWHAANRERVKETKRKRYLADSERVKAKAQAYREANPERVALVNRTWRSSNVERLREYRAANSERRRAHRHARRARMMRAASDAYTHADFMAAMEERDVWRCSYCDGPAEHVEHVIPLSRGGSNDVSNLTWACASCNLSKGARLLSEWLPSRLSELERLAQ